ncbi:MAG: GNAT family N-acetyltransferase [Symbiobacteriia bacterium]
MFTHQIDEDVQLKLLDLSDTPAIFALVDRSRDYLRQWLPWVDGTQAVDDLRTFIQSTLDQFAADNGFQAGILYRGELAGVIGYHLIDRRNRKTSIGYWLGQEFQGHGLMTKATRALVDIAFHEYGLNRVEIRAATGNLKSRAIPERLGFRNEGCSLQAEWLYDHFIDHVIYGVLAADWPATEGHS